MTAYPFVWWGGLHWAALIRVQGLAHVRTYQLLIHEWVGLTQ